MIIPLMISSLSVGITLLYASRLDIQDRRVPFRTWYPMLIVGIPMTLLFYGSLLMVEPGMALRYLGLVGLFCALFYLFAYLRLFGGADAWALIFIGALVPLFPLEPYFKYPTLQLFPFTVLTNAVILNLATPIGIAIVNKIKGNRAPFPYPFFGFPVPGERIEQYFGFVMEEIKEEDDHLTRRFLTIRESLGRLFRGEDRLYTKDMRLHPEEYREERELFRKAGEVWISYGVPFIVPITAGFFTALLAGDLLFTLMKYALGV